MENHRILSGHRAVITGASSGIGEEYARQLAALGADLVIIARRIDRLEKMAQELKSKHSVQVECLQVDLATEGAADRIFSETTKNSKQVTILINNAGLGRFGNFIDFDFKDHYATLLVNAVVPTQLSYLFIKHMMAHRRPSYITQVASISAFQPVSNFTVYSGTKGYLRYFSETLDFELRGSNIHMLCLCPGGVYTEFLEYSGQKLKPQGHRTMMKADVVVRSGIKAMLKGKRLYVPGLLNKLACFLPRLIPRGLALWLAFKTMNQAVERTRMKS